MVLRSRRSVLLSLAVLSTLLPGCAGRRPVGPWGPGGGTPLGVELSLPDGTWLSEVVRRDKILEFRRPDTLARVVLMRLPCREGESCFIGLRRLFAHFDEKIEIARRTRAIPSGLKGDFAEYLVQEGARTLHVHAAAFRRDATAVYLVGWGMDRKTFDAIADSIAVRDKEEG